MVRTSKWNKQLNTSARLQSGLGRVEDVYKEPASSFIMATVAKVNYLYNTVDVVTINYSERLIKDSSTQGRFSAQLPVSYGGSFTNGTVYGKTVPINIGDMVLIGFVGENKDNPIVLNIYKSPSVSYTLAPTDAVSGNPEDASLYDNVMEDFTVYPGQTYDWLSGEGTIERTFQGKGFLKSSQPLLGNGNVNDFGYSYDQLYRPFLRGQYLTPTELNAPKVLYQHTGDDISFINNVFFDNNGDMRMSTISKDGLSRAELFFEGTDSLGLRYQKGSNKHNSEETSEKSEISIINGVPVISFGSHSLTFNDKDGLLVDGAPLSDWTGGNVSSRLDNLENDIKTLNDKVNELSVDEIISQLLNINKQIKSITSDISSLTESVSEYDKKINKAVSDSEAAQQLSNKVAEQLSNAAGTDASLVARLDRIDGTVKALQDVIVEIVAARTYNTTSKTYSSLGVRLDTIQDIVVSDNKRLSDLVDKLDIFLSDDFGKGVASYVVTIQAYGDLVMRNGQGSVTLDARVYKTGFEWTSLLDDGAFVWERHSDDPEGDAAWNANHLDGSKILTLTGVDFGYSANFTVNVTVQGHLIEN